MGETKDLTCEVIDLMVEAVNLHHVDRATLNPDTRLTGGDLELDSIDVLELIVTLEQRYGVKIRNEESGKKIFQTIGTLVEFVKTNRT